MLRKCWEAGELTFAEYKKSSTGEWVAKIFGDGEEGKCTSFGSMDKKARDAVGILVKENLAQDVVETEDSTKDNEDKDGDGEKVEEFQKRPCS